MNFNVSSELSVGSVGYLFRIISIVLEVLMNSGLLCFSSKLRAKASRYFT